MDFKNKAPDFLTSLPAEVFIMIIANLPSSACFLPISQTSARIRKFMADNAAAICNGAIRIRYKKHAELLQSITINGWLTPTLPRILEMERQYTTSRLYGLDKKTEEQQVAWEFKIKVSEPGPQFLYMLETGFSQLYVDVEKTLRDMEEEFRKFTGRTIRNVAGLEQHNFGGICLWGSFFLVGMVLVNDQGETRCGVDLEPHRLVRLDQFLGKTTTITGTRSHVKAMIWYYGLSRSVLVPNEWLWSTLKKGFSKIWDRLLHGLYGEHS